MGDKQKYRAAEITAWLTEHIPPVDPDAARQCGRVVAEAWNNREFYASATGLPLVKCLKTSACPASRAAGIANGLARRFGVFLHDHPDFDPDVFWRKAMDPDERHWTDGE